MNNRRVALNALNKHIDENTVKPSDEDLLENLAAISRLLRDWNYPDSLDRQVAHRIITVLTQQLEERGVPYDNKHAAQTASFIYSA